MLTMTAFVLSCLCPALFWGKKAFLAWTAALAAIISVPYLFPHGPASLDATWFIYALVPLVLWYRHRVSTRNEVRARWPRVRDGITALYIPAVLGDCVCMVLLGFWGLLVYLAGITLISLGYMQLAREANRSLASQSFQGEGQTQ